MGSSGATAQGAKIFERLNKVILASVSYAWNEISFGGKHLLTKNWQWENIVTKNTPERVSLVQASVIGQTFAYLSGVSSTQFDSKRLLTPHIESEVPGNG